MSFNFSFPVPHQPLVPQPALPTAASLQLLQFHFYDADLVQRTPCVLLCVSTLLFGNSNELIDLIVITRRRHLFQSIFKTTVAYTDMS